MAFQGKIEAEMALAQLIHDRIVEAHRNGICETITDLANIIHDHFQEWQRTTEESKGV